MEIATHPILREAEAARINPTHSHITRVCVSCVTNTGLSKSTNLCPVSTLRRPRGTNRFLVWPGGEVVKNTASPRGQRVRSIAFTSFKIKDSFRVKIDPQGKPAGYRSIPQCGMVPMWPY